MAVAAPLRRGRDAIGILERISSDDDGGDESGRSFVFEAEGCTGILGRNGIEYGIVHIGFEWPGVAPDFEITVGIVRMSDCDRDPLVAHEVDALLCSWHEADLDLRSSSEKPYRVDLGLAGPSQCGDEREGGRFEKIMKRVRY